MLAEERAPSGHPSRRAVKHWRFVDGLTITLLFALFSVITAYRWTELSVWLGDASQRLAAAVVALFLLTVGWYAGLLPWLAVRFYRYELTDDAVYYQRGLLTRTRTVVPYARVQSVKTTAGPIERRMGLTTLVLVTAADAHKIAMLDEEIADELRERISALSWEATDDL